MINIVHVGFSHNPGGVENMVMNYYRNIDKSKVHFDFIDIYSNGIAYCDEIQLLGGNVYLLPNFKRHPIQSYRELKHILHTKDIDIVHVHMQSAANLLPILAGLSEKKTVIAHAHSSATPTGLSRKMLHSINTKVLRKLPVQRWACSATAGKWMYGDLFDEENKIVNAIDMKRYQADAEIRKKSREECHFNQNDKIIGFVGRFGEEKNPMFLLDVLKELRIKSDEYKLLVVGGGDLFDEFEQKAKEQGLREVIFSAGVQRNTEKWYQAMDAFLLPSSFEGFPLVAVEAQAMGLPCCFSERITREVDLTGCNKFVTIDGADAVMQWAEAIEQVLKKSENEACDSGKLKGYDIICSSEHLLKKYTKLLNSLKNEE